MKKNKITKEDLVNQIENWRKRLSDLYSIITEWLKDDKRYSVKTTDTVQIYEELMQKYKINPQNFPVADILKNGKLILSIKPFGLWVIGANGRIDIITGKGSQMLTDMSEQFQAPQWTVFSPKNRRKGLPFTKDYLLGIMR